MTGVTTAVADDRAPGTDSLKNSAAFLENVFYGKRCFEDTKLNEWEQQQQQKKYAWNNNTYWRQGLLKGAVADPTSWCLIT